MNIVKHLNDLLKLEHDAVRAYKTAIDNILDADIQENLGRFRNDHERHIALLTQRIKDNGGAPQQRPDLLGPFIMGLTAVMSKMGDLNALRVMHQNENLTNRAYDGAVKDDYPAELHEMMEEFQADERRHRAWIDDKMAELKGEAAAPSAEARPEDRP